MARFNWAPYQRATYCYGKPQRGTIYLGVFLTEQFPGSYVGNIYSCRDIVGGSSLSHHAEGRADDHMTSRIKPPSGISQAEEMLELIGPHGKALGIDHLILNLAPWSSGRGRPMIYNEAVPMGRPYTGLHPHKDHNHNGQTRWGASNMTLSLIRSIVLGVTPPVPAPIPPPVPQPPLVFGAEMIPTKKSSEDEIRFFQELLNDTYGSTLTLNGRWGDGMDGIVQKLLVPLTDDPDPEVKAGTKINARQWKTLLRDWIRKVVQ